MNIPRGERGQIPALTRVINRLAAWPGEDIETRPTGERSGAGCEGNALVEFALVLPLFMILMTAIFTFGVAVMNQLTLSQAVDAGARHLALIRTSTLDPCADTATAIDQGHDLDKWSHPFAADREFMHWRCDGSAGCADPPRDGDCHLSLQSRNLREELCAQRVPAFRNGNGV